MKKLIVLLIVLTVCLSGRSAAFAEGPKETARQSFGQILAIGFSDGSVSINTGHVTVQLPPAPELGPVHSLVFRPDGKFLAVIYDRAYTFLDLTNLYAAFDPVKLGEGCHILTQAYDWLEKSQTAIFSIAVICDSKVEIQTSVWAQEDGKTVILTLPDAR